MTVALKTTDQVLGTGMVEGPQLTFRTREVTAREIVRARVTAEVERYNSTDEPRAFVGLVTPAEQEQELNGPRRPRPRSSLDVERQIQLATDAPLLITPVSEARFLRLVPLVGG